MVKKQKQTPQSNLLSKELYKRGEESEIIRILTEIDKGFISKLGACKKYGLNRNTLRLWITKLSIRNLEGKISNTFFTEMDENSKNKALEKRIHELSKSLEYAKLKIAGLETMIKVAEEDLKIKIGKSLVPNRQKIKANFPISLLGRFARCLVSHDSPITRLSKERNKPLLLIWLCCV